MKWDFEKMQNKGNNTKVAKWLPQSDLLRKYFLTEQRKIYA